MEDDIATHGCVMFLPEKPSSPTLQILAFETAKNMSRLIALYKSLTDEEFSKLRNGTVRSAGVVFLNSTNESYLLGLACKEKLEDLNQIASVVSRLSKRCVNEELTRFETAYQIMKQGVIDISNLDFNSKNAVKIIEKMEKYARATSLLYTSLTGLNELELSEKRMQRSNNENINDKISFQRKQVRHFKHVSLWNKKFDKIVALMARIICTVYARICVLFGVYAPGLLATVTTTTTKRRSIRRLCVSHTKAFHMKPKVYPEADYGGRYVKEDDKMKKISKSGPILIASKMKRGATRFISSELSPESEGLGFGFLLPGVTMTNKASTNVNQRLIQSTPANTVGASGLAFRYANIIINAETYFHSTTIITDDARTHMFEMLPINLKQTLRGKLRCQCHKDERESQGLAEWWKEALAEIIGRLAPVARDTLRWQLERNLEQQKLDARPTVLLFQTLHFSNLEKTEAAIVEMLVGLSYIYRYENRREKNDVGT
ncbi:putative EF-TU receptor [Hibiscus syriacus]|uniref:EF-TU receptor n=1 Tax=Hibiscus syriacus TaxID=106335 RepID=A0A6A2Z522_HIBSY|nr:uncharacterized protein LOC120150956 [Hibiscus syriacus]KAE8686998.1 putative EF-TU receptor [Hibiscus syriacus]